MTTLTVRDERETAVDRAADRLSFLVLAYGTLAVAAWRSFNGEATWDLLALVIVAGGAGLAYRYAKGVVTRSWLVVATASAIAAVIVAAILVAGLVK